jgi:hypothetical protein
MPGYTDNAKDGMLGQVRGRITHLSLHTASPGDSGANEVTGGGYARAAVGGADFTSPAAGEFELNNDKECDGPASEARSHFGAWDDATFLGGGAITGDTMSNAEGKFVLKAGTSFDIQ